METASKERLYRILPFDRAVEIINGSLYFSHPSAWEDPFETIVSHDAAHAMFAQCWCMNGVSDAMWRIYSPNNLSVRIRTTRSKLNTAMSNAASKGYKKRVRDVEYLTTQRLKDRAEAIAKKLKKNFSLSTAADTLFIKRNAFQHENEVRALLYCADAPTDTSTKGWQLKIDGHQLIDSVLLDPRIPKHFGIAMINYLRQEIGFTGVVQKSVLYDRPTVIDGRVPEEDL